MPIRKNFKKGNPLLDAVDAAWLNSIENRLAALEGLDVVPPLFVSMAHGRKIITNPVRNTKVRLGQLEGELDACGAAGQGSGTANLIRRDSSASNVCDQFAEDTNTPIDVINHSSTAIDDNTVGLIVEHINADIKTNLFFPVPSPFLKIGKLASGGIIAISGNTPGTGTVDIWEFTNGSVAATSGPEQVTAYNFNDNAITNGDFVLLHKEKASDRWLIIDQNTDYSFSIIADDGVVTLLIETGETVDFEGTAGTFVFNPRAQSEWGIVTQAVAGSPNKVQFAVDPSVLQHFTATADTASGGSNAPLLDVAIAVTTAQMDIENADVSGTGNWFEIINNSGDGLQLIVDSSKALFQYKIINPIWVAFGDTGSQNINHGNAFRVAGGTCITTIAQAPGGFKEVEVNLDDIFKIGKANGEIAAISSDTPGRLVSPGNEVSVYEFTNGDLADTAVDLNAYNVTDQIIANGEYVYLALETDSKRWQIIRTLGSGGSFTFDISGDIDGTAFTINSGDEISFIGDTVSHDWDENDKFIQVETIEDASAGIHEVRFSTAKLIRVGKAGGGIAAIVGSDPGTGVVTIYDDDGTGTWTSNGQTETGYNFTTQAISASDWLYLEMSMEDGDENKWLVHPLVPAYTWIVDADTGGPKTIINGDKLFIKGTTDEIIVTLSGVSPTFSAVIKVGDAIMKDLVLSAVAEVASTSPAGIQLNDSNVDVEEGTANALGLEVGPGLSVDGGTNSGKVILQMAIQYGRTQAAWVTNAGDAYVNVQRTTSRTGAGSGTTFKVYLPRTNDGDPNVIAAKNLAYARDEFGTFTCLSDYMDDKIGTIKMWKNATADIATGWSRISEFAESSLDVDGIYPRGETGTAAVDFTSEGSNVHTHEAHDDHRHSINTSNNVTAGMVRTTDATCTGIDGQLGVRSITGCATAPETGVRGHSDANHSPKFIPVHFILRDDNSSA